LKALNCKEQEQAKEDENKEEIKQIEGSNEIHVFHEECIN